MAQVRPRSPTVDDAHHKRLKTSHSTDTDSDIVAQFATNLFDASNIEQLRSSYVDSTPFKNVFVETLFRDDLLRDVKDECTEHLSLTEKETDIYKVNQTGDLASLSYLSDEQRALFPSLLTLRDALYSSRFRAFLRAVTGCGPLSGTKQDMSVNSYTRGCHLLNHDDVIGTRRVSYILYMPLPYDKPWRTEYGGALELYPVRQGGDVPEPEVAPVKAIPPSWNQFVFFEVQPGKSFHSVEEVVVDQKGHVRLSISGWFHAAQPGEEGYVAEEATATQENVCSREQLTSSSNLSRCAGKFTQYDDTGDDTEPPHPDVPLSPAYTSFLAKYLNPAYLQLRTLMTIMAKFVDESHLQLQNFLVDELAAALEEGLGEADVADGLSGTSRGGKVPCHGLGVPPSSATSPWTVKAPPHKWRYCTLAQQHDLSTSSLSSPSSSGPTARAKAEDILRELQDTFFPSAAFRAWLTIVTKLIPLSSAVEARRFRPGLDYTLATSDEGESRLDIVLGLTPQPKKTDEENGIRHGKAKAKASEDEDEPTGWQAGEWGGWECYMAPHDEEDDPAVYRSGSSKKAQAKEGPESSGASASHDVDDTDEDEDEDEEDEDGTLLTWQPHFNCLLLVLRDEGVLRFVKYVSAAAPGSRWDICSDFEVGMVEGDDEDEEEP
ncbi:nuclear protein [Boletus reticuloceps]|uniref:uS12 prolyl 3,4-dihydroxylase n=1 Tax=Boletus reticuloceps TaxID=495285 RepID=A0A8I3AE37_9AGAM|nr:nuclear protein [Boletus reticuloceps]